MELCRRDVEAKVLVLGEPAREDLLSGNWMFDGANHTDRKEAVKICRVRSSVNRHGWLVVGVRTNRPDRNSQGR
jgi:hypothetical protein